MAQQFFDGHCHAFDIPGFKLRDDFTYVITGYSRESSEKVLAYGQPNVIKAIGIAPQTVSMKKGHVEENLEFIEENAFQADAIGEIGLDFKWAADGELRKKQETAFVFQLQAAKKHNLPVVIHSRRAEKRVLEILVENGFKRVLLHCFCGNETEVKKGAAEGFFFTASPRATATLLDFVPLDHLILESDSPAIGKTPEDIVVSAELVAKRKKMPFEDAVSLTFENGMRFFKLE